jgi:hypothetical protein
VHVVEGEFVLVGGELAECALAASAVVGVFDPDGDRESELVSGLPGASVEDVYRKMSLSGSSNSRWRSCAIVKFAIQSSTGLPKKTMRSASRRE